MKEFKIDAKVFLSREKKLLQYLMSRPFSKKIADAARESFKYFSKTGYAFEVSWEFGDHGPKLKITVAGQAQTNTEGNFSFLTYALCVSRDNELLRKFHYDHESNTQGNKPFFHLQYGGNPLPSQEDCNGKDALESWLSEPRLFSTPMSLALILEQMFLEFPNDDTRKIQNCDSWKGLVLKSQKEILGPYFERCCKKISDNERLYSQCYL